MAAHLRAAFPGDGEEVADVIARHYLDALDAVPEDPDTAQIRDQAITTLIRAAERAKRTGAPALAATSYATAAQLTEENGHDGERAAGELWERAADAAADNADYAVAIEHAGRARDHHQQRGDSRAAAHAQATAGNALFLRGRHADAREYLTAALDVLQAEPDTNTLRALVRLAILEVFAGAAEADRITTEALILGQAIGATSDQIVRVFGARGLYLSGAGRHNEAVAYYHEAARLAAQADDNALLGAVLGNLSDALAVTDPAAAAEAARKAIEHSRRAGIRGNLTIATANLAQALLLLGDWDAANGVLTQAVDSDGLADIDYLSCHRGLLAALRGDTHTADTLLAGLRDMRASEDPQDKALINVVEAFTAAARGQPGNALRYARSTLAHVGALGISAESLRWAWPLAARVAYELCDTQTSQELFSLLDMCRPGHLAPMLRGERDLARARLADQDGGQAATASFAAAISGLRQLSTPYHLAHGLLDHAQHLSGMGDADAAAAAIDEAGTIARQLGCQPLLDRADAIEPAKTRAGA